VTPYRVRGLDERRPPLTSAGIGRSIYLPPWRLDITVRAGVMPRVPQKVLARTVAAALAAVGAPEPASVGLFLSDDAELSELNRDAMGINGPTDVLSFPLLPPSAFPDHPGRPAGGAGAGVPKPFILPPGRRPHLGDIVISVERAADQARQGRGGQTGDVRWTPADELRLLVIHATLHLCGWDHAQPEEAAAMRSLERRLVGD
jgi:probable rRNA maturation factor